MRYLLFILLFSPFISTITAQEDAKVDAILEKFEQEYKALTIRQMQISYVDNLSEIRAPKQLLQQEKFFKQVHKMLSGIKEAQLSKEKLLSFELLNYQTALELERIAAEKIYAQKRPDSIHQKGLYYHVNGKALYQYYLKNWIDAEATPDKIFAFGKEQVASVYAQILAIQKELELDSVSFYQHIDEEKLRFKSSKDIPAALEATKEKVLKGTSSLFKDYQVPDVAIAKGISDFLKEAPGYYNPPMQTLYYNLTKEMEYPRNTGWLFIHEGVPGHHFQMAIEHKTQRTPVHQFFHFYCYREGWAAYCEEIGKELGGYPTIYDELGKLEWDIIRSVRVVLDVALNYYGWSDEKALEYWKQYIPMKDDVGRREIARMKRWPCQVISYKYGSQKILEWKAKAKETLKENFDIKEFHDQVLKHGSLPLSILEKRVLEYITS